MYRPLKVTGLQTPTDAPDGVLLTGARADGSYLVLRYEDARTYMDRFFNSEGKEVMRVSGEIVEEASWWRRWLRDPYPRSFR